MSQFSNSSVCLFSEDHLILGSREFSAPMRNAPAQDESKGECWPVVPFPVVVWLNPFLIFESAILVGAGNGILQPFGFQTLINQFVEHLLKI